MTRSIPNRLAALEQGSPVDLAQRLARCPNCDGVIWEDDGAGGRRCHDCGAPRSSDDAADAIVVVQFEINPDIKISASPPYGGVPFPAASSGSISPTPAGEPEGPVNRTALR